MDKTTELLGRLILFLETQLIFGDRLSFLDYFLYLLIPPRSFRLVLPDIIPQIAQTFVDEPEIVLALVQGRKGHDFHQRLFVILEQDGFVFLPEEMGGEGFCLEAVEELLHGFLEGLGESCLDCLVGNFGDGEGV